MLLLRRTMTNSSVSFPAYPASPMERADCGFVRGLFCLLVVLTGIPHLRAASLAVEQETLGAWHYLLPLESYPSGAAKCERPVFAPTVVEYDQGRIAAVVPGSKKVAELKEGAFEELPLPENVCPCSLGVNRKGQLYCLAQREDHLTLKDGWLERWVTSWTDETGWSTHIQVPFPGATRLEFDAQNRLWVLGPDPSVAVFAEGQWQQYRFADAPRRSLAPIRMASLEGGDVALFSCVPFKQTGFATMPGALIYHEGKFTRDPKRDVSALAEEENWKDVRMTSDDFDRRTGYICHSTALNMRRTIAMTVLKTPQYGLVSFGNSGFAWARTEALRTTPALDENAEWEKLDDILALPVVGADGTLWVARDHPRRLVKITKDHSEEFPAPDLEVNPYTSGTIMLDQLDRPWIFSPGSSATVAVLRQGKLIFHRSPLEALSQEATLLKSGRIFPQSPLYVKTGLGVICVLDYSDFTISGAGRTRAFSAEQISPGHEKRIVMPRHGYNPFRNGEPQFDERGNIYTQIDGTPFRYRQGRWQPASMTAAEWKKLEPPAETETGNKASAPFETEVPATIGRKIVFRWFHFYEVSSEGQRTSLDQGMNPLAYYPFWTSWYESPGLTTPLLDPTGRLWISPMGPYSQNHVWMRLRQKP